MNTGKMSTLSDFAVQPKRKTGYQLSLDSGELDRLNLQMDSTTSVILSNSSGQISGQLVKPNWQVRAMSDWMLDKEREGTHVDHAPFAEQVLVREGLTVLVGQGERTSDLGTADPCCGILLPFAFVKLLLFVLEIEVQGDTSRYKDGASFEGERLRRAGKVSVAPRIVELRESSRTPAAALFWIEAADEVEGFADADDDGVGAGAGGGGGVE